MKKLVLTLVLFLIAEFITDLKAQNSNYIYNSNGDKFYFIINKSKKYFQFKNNIAIEKKKEIISKIKKDNISVVQLENNIYCAHIPLNHLNKNSNIPDDTIFNNNTFSCLCNELICASDSTIQWVGQDVFIKIKRGFNIDSILSILNVSYTKINHWNNYCQEECIICVEDENAIDCANRLFESNYFVYAMPSFYRLLKLNSLSYKDQWNLSNTGQLNGISDIDINIEDAWQITKGDTNITISVIDNGIDIYHEDLYANMLPGHGLFPFDSLGLYNDNGNFDDSHGTMCAGIIAAMDNDTGIIGIANKSKIISVKYHPILLSDTFMVHVINYSYLNAQASVLNCSWEIQGSRIPAMESAINNAVKYGRNGKGSVVVFSAGNNNIDTLSYPAGLECVIAVGGMDRYARRSYLSSYGQKLSVVAPGSSVPSTAIKNQYWDFMGTSVAAPHVSGIAALMLSVNPELSPSEVKRIIEKTARKIGCYNYCANSQHPNGTWNEEMGYGLVDAHAAVLNAVDSTLDLYVRDSENDNGNEPSATTTPWNSPDIWIEDTNGRVVSNLEGLMEYNVCVRIHNRTGHTSTGYEKLYLNWVKAGPSTEWSEAWKGRKWHTSIYFDSVIIGGAITMSNGHRGHYIPSIANGRDTVVRVRWKAPNPSAYQNYFVNSELNHFCLCARIHDGQRIENEDADGVNMGEFVKNSSHVAWKNIEILSGADNKGEIWVFSLRNKPVCFRYTETPAVTGEQLHEYAEVKLKLDTGLYNVWQRGGFTGSGFVLQADSSLLLQSANAELCSLLLDTSRIYLMQTSVQFRNRLVPQNSTFHADIVQYYEYDENGIHVSELVGGEHYKAVRSGDCEYTVQIAGDTDLLQGEAATFTATGAESYRWYNAGGELLGTAETMTAVPAYSQCYYLETTGGLCGYISRDTVRVHVSEGEIVTLYPNPTNDFVHLEYQITGNYNNASIQITNELGTTQQTVTLNEPQGSATLDVQGLPAGAYYVLLKSPNGRVLDIKTLVKGE